MPTAEEIRMYKIGTCYKESRSEIPPAVCLYGILPIVFNDGYIVFSRINEYNKDTQEVILEVTDTMFGTPCRQHGSRHPTSFGQGNNLCCLTDRLCKMPTGQDLEEACSIFQTRAREIEILKDMEKLCT